jgi:hypothetical protein
MAVCIKEGFLEGRLSSSKLRRALKKRGYSITTAAEGADIIIAHSGGWVFLPQLRDNQRLILVDPAYRTTESALTKSIRRARYDAAHFTFGMLWQRSVNVWYLLNIPKWLELKRRYDTLDITTYTNRVNTTICRVDDPAWWCDDMLYKSPATIVYIGGDHDSFWRRPLEFLQKIDL